MAESTSTVLLRIPLHFIYDSSQVEQIIDLDKTAKKYYRARTWKNLSLLNPKYNVLHAISHTAKREQSQSRIETQVLADVGLSGSQCGKAQYNKLCVSMQLRCKIILQPYIQILRNCSHIMIRESFVGLEGIPGLTRGASEGAGLYLILYYSYSLLLTFVMYQI